LNSSYKGTFGNGWQLTTGLGYGYSHNTIALNLDNVFNAEHSSHMKLKFRKSFTDRIKLTFGGDYFITKFNESFDGTQDLLSGVYFKSGYHSNIAAIFAEEDVFFSKKFAAKLGVRASHNDLLKESAIVPRISFAYKVSKKGQFSLAYGKFTEAPKQDYLKYADYLSSEKANHYIFNYQYSKDKQTFRSELYFKDYSSLVKYETLIPLFTSNYSNNGKGYAKGIDVFWRDGKSVKNLEYWISYSYIDTKRDYKNYTAEVTPSFVANNSLSVVGKYWIERWKSQVSITNSYTTGRPYNNPNETIFMNSKTKSYNSLSMSWAYLLTTQKILYFSISNLLGTQNIYGYEYANAPDANGYYNRRAITPTADRFFFIGFFWTISDTKNENQLKNL
jgi:hypothetical protein